MADELIVGMMSGTSVDGIDTALVSFEAADDLRVISTEFTEFEPSLKTRINDIALAPNLVSIEQHEDMDRELAVLYARAALSLIKKAGLKPSQIRAIANHGQTVHHQPSANPPISIQLGSPQHIADLGGIPTVGYFRQADLAAGGQGAPLMPAFHKTVFAHYGAETVILNIGGIANITRLGETILGFDTGPGNTLLDQWVWRCKQEVYDQDGEWAASGKRITPALKKLLRDPYFQLAAPKSTGTDYFNLEWLEGILGPLEKFVAEDLQATLMALTVETIARDIEHYSQQQLISNVYAYGGGTNNKALMRRLRHRLPNVHLGKTDDLGIDADWLEAVGFAWLGYCQLHGIPSNLPSVTGAKKQVVLGERYVPRGARAKV